MGAATTNAAGRRSGDPAAQGHRCAGGAPARRCARGDGPAGIRARSPTLPRALSEDQKITLVLGCSDRAVDLIREGVDCALRGGGLPDSRLAARGVGNLRFVLCAAPRYIDAQGSPDTLDDLAQHDQVGLVGASAGKARPIQLTRSGQTVELDVPASAARRSLHRPRCPVNSLCATSIAPALHRPSVRATPATDSGLRDPSGSRVGHRWPRPIRWRRPASC